MGQNLILNINDHGFVVICGALYNRNRYKVERVPGPHIQNIFQSIAAKVEAESMLLFLWTQYVPGRWEKKAQGTLLKMVHNGMSMETCRRIARPTNLMKDFLGMEQDDMAKAVFARCLSSLKSERTVASKQLKGPKPIKFSGDKKAFLEDIRKALYASKIISYAQGFILFRQAAQEYGWNLNYGGIAMMWRGGCIIRSVFLGKIKEAFDQKPDLQNLLLDSFFKKEMENCQESWRRVISTGVQHGIPMPCFTTALSFYDGYRHEMLPANLIQAQRDYFGAHTYELLSKPGQFVHTNWTGHGGNVSSSSYNA
ncbi:hypothetical protein FKM82_014195 [Ascaphus truei]